MSVLAPTYALLLLFWTQCGSDASSACRPCLFLKLFLSSHSLTTPASSPAWFLLVILHIFSVTSSRKSVLVLQTRSRRLLWCILKTLVMASESLSNCIASTSFCMIHSKAINYESRRKFYLGHHGNSSTQHVAWILNRNLINVSWMNG